MLGYSDTPNNSEGFDASDRSIRSDIRDSFGRLNHSDTPNNSDSFDGSDRSNSSDTCNDLVGCTSFDVIVNFYYQCWLVQPACGS